MIHGADGESQRLKWQVAKKYNKQTIQTAYLASDEIHRLRRLGSKPLLRGFSRSYWLVWQRVAVVCVYIFCMLSFQTLAFTT